jgi:multiple sugar transport system substrate-binding protein
MRPQAIRRGVRVLAVAAVALVAASCVSGGTGSSNNSATQPGQKVQPIIPKEPTSPVTVTFSSWVGDSQEMKKLAADFKKLHPNITIKFQNVPADSATQKLTTQIAGGNAPDTAFLDSSVVQTFASKNALANLDGYIAGSKVVNIDDYVQGFKQTALYKDTMYALPFDGETTGLFYRTDLFQAAGIASPPTTWEEFEAAAAKLTDPAKKQYGFIMFAPEAQYYWLPFLWQNGGRLMSQDGKTITFNNQQAVQAADFYVGLRKYAPPDYLNSNSWDGRVAFAEGKVGMYVAGAWFGGEMKTSFPKINGKWSVAPLPKGSAGCATTIAGDSLVVLDQSKNRDAAWMWIEYLSRPENMKTWTFGSPTATLLPPRQSLLSDPELGKHNPWLKGFADQMSCAVNESLNNPKWPEVSDALNTELGKAVYGDQTPTEALTKAAQKGEQLLR